MFIQQAFKAQNQWWRYVIGIIITIIAVVIGQIPLTAAILIWGDIDPMYVTPDTLYEALEPNLTMFLLLLSFAIGLVGLLFVIRFIHQQPILEATTSRKKMDWGRFAFGFALIAIVNILFFAVGYLSNPEDYVWNFQAVPFLILLVITVVMVPLQIAFEEYLFRGYLMQGLGVLARNRWFPLIVTSLIFGLLHLSNPEVGKMGEIVMLIYIGNGFVLGIMTLMDEGMELALGYHAGNNIVASLMLTADWTAFQGHSLFKDVSDPSVTTLEVLAQVLIFFPAILLIMARKYKWTNWREKLFGKVDPPPVEEPMVLDRTEA